MRQKLALLLGLMVLAASVMLGVGAAGAKQVNVPGVGSVDVPLPVCANGADDDGDGLIDLADPGCTSSVATSEYNAPVPVPEPVPATPEPTTPTGPTGTTGGGGSAPSGGKGGSTTNSGIGGDSTTADGGLQQNDTLGNGAPQNSTLKALEGIKGNDGGPPPHPPAPFKDDGSPNL